jgi:hypothetical protein
MLTRYRALPAEERRELQSALWRLLLIRLSLFGSIHGTQQRFGGQRSCQRTLTRLEECRIWERRATALRRVSSWIPGARCLARSLALRWWMRGCGIAAILIMGARRDSDGLHSHSWIEVNGKPVDDRPENVSRFTVIWREDSGATNRVTTVKCSHEQQRF